jgi:hypothetical protein
MSLSLGAAEREREILSDRLLKTREPLIRFSLLAGFLCRTHAQLFPRDQWAMFIMPQLSELLAIATPLLLRQQSPERLSVLAETLDALPGEARALQLREDVDEARMAQALYAGDVEYLRARFDLSDADLPAGEPLQIAQALVAQIRDSEQARKLEAFIRIWSGRLESASSVSVLLVTPNDANWPAHGVLTTLTLQHERGAELSHVQFEHLGDSADAAMIALDSAMQAASRWLSRELNLSRPVGATLRLDDVQSDIEGPSLGLAIAALCIADGLSRSLSRKQFRFSTSVALIGALDAEGRVQSVEGIREKITRAFYSPVEHVAVPHDQEELARATADELHRRYPNRHLSIVPVSTLDDLFSQRRLVADYLVPLPLHAVKQIERVPKWARVIFALVALLLLVYAPISHYYPNTRFWLDRTPAIWDTGSGHVLRILNKDHVLLWDKFADQSEFIRWGYFGRSDNDTLAPAFSCTQFADINGDGRQEVLFLRSTVTDMGTKTMRPETLYCFAANGNALWKHACDPQNLSAFGMTGTFPTDVWTWTTVDWKGDGNSDIVLSQKDGSSKGMFYAFLEQLDGRTGETKHIFWHRQWLWTVCAVPNDTNRGQSLWVGGTNDDCGSELFIFRDSVRSRIWPSADTVGIIAARFPICDVNLSLEQCGWLWSLSLCENKTVQITMLNSQIQFPQGGGWTGYSFRVRHDLSWYPEPMIRFQSRQLLRFVRAGVIPEPENYDEWIARNTFAEIWTGHDWVPADTTRPPPDPYPIYTFNDSRVK